MNVKCLKFFRKGPRNLVPVLLAYYFLFSCVFAQPCKHPMEPGAAAFPLGSVVVCRAPGNPSMTKIATVVEHYQLGGVAGALVIPHVDRASSDGGRKSPLALSEPVFIGFSDVSLLATGGATSAGRPLPADGDAKVGILFKGLHGKVAVGEFRARDVVAAIQQCRATLVDGNTANIARVEAALASTDIDAASLARGRGDHEAWGNLVSDMLLAAALRHAYWGEPIAFLDAAEYDAFCAGHATVWQATKDSPLSYTGDGVDFPVALMAQVPGGGLVIVPGSDGASLTARAAAKYGATVHTLPDTCARCSKGRAADAGGSSGVCSRCRAASAVLTWYCSADCQRADWPRHRVECSAAAARALQASDAS